MSNLDSWSTEKVSPFSILLTYGIRLLNRVVRAIVVRIQAYLAQPRFNWVYPAVDILFHLLTSHLTATGPAVDNV
jgi:hypothetical protein